MAVGPASEEGRTISALRPGAAPGCPAVPGSPHFWWCFGNLPGRVRPRRKLKANSAANEAQTFFDATLPQGFGGDLGRRAGLCACKVGVVGEESLGRPSLALDETPGKAPPLPYFSPTPRPQSVKIVSNVWRTPRMCLWGSHQREGSFVKVVERALPRSVRPAGLKKAEDQLASPGVECLEIGLGRPQPSPLPSPRTRA